MHSDTHNPHFTNISVTDFCCKHNNLNMLFAPRTLLTVTDKCLGKWVTILALVLL